MSLALRLCIVRRQLGGDAAPEIDCILAETVDELRLAVEELRELAAPAAAMLVRALEGTLEARDETLVIRLPSGS